MSDQESTSSEQYTLEVVLRKYHHIAPAELQAAVDQWAIEVRDHQAVHLFSEKNPDFVHKRFVYTKDFSGWKINLAADEVKSLKEALDASGSPKINECMGQTTEVVFTLMEHPPRMRFISAVPLQTIRTFNEALRTARVRQEKENLIYLLGVFSFLTELARDKITEPTQAEIIEQAKNRFIEMIHDQQQ